MKLAEKLASVPLEYQASVYAKEMKLRHQKEQERNRDNLTKLRSQLKAMKEEIKATHNEELREKLLKEIKALEKSIGKAPRPKRQWSPILPGSFETRKK
jgi:ribosomal protein S20